MKSVEERMAVVETRVEYIAESQDRVWIELSKANDKLDLLLGERHQSLGKKTMLLTIAGFFGAILSHLINFFRQ